MQLIEFAYMLVIDLMFILLLIVLMLPLGIWRQAAFAVMKRNFAGYFSNPTGYVFLCLFVLLTSFAAFWPHAFFTTNLANFDQLNKFLPYIMLVFIPAITMSIWAEERRQGTDELLLTLPAKDFDIVIGKYFAAVLIFTVSLFFSQLSNYAVLIAMTGGQLDSLLLFSTYLGYWFIGIAMLAVGMVASFLTNNLTVGFIFGAAFNAPLAFFSNADVIFSNSTWVQRLFDWSLLQRFEPFGRGLVSLSSIIYFLGIVVIGIYLSLILIGRRHWLGGRDGTSMLWHYLARAICLAATVIACVLIVQHSPLNKARVDISEQQVSTLSDSTVRLLKELADQAGDKPEIKINAYISDNIPTEFVRTKYDLVNLLREFDVLGGKRVQVNLFQGIEPFSKDAIDAEKKFGIRPVRIASESRGAIKEDDIVLGAAFQCGRERVVIKFFPYGTPVEYELMRSIKTVSQTERKTIGIVETDAFITGAVMSINGQQQRIPPLQIIAELEKQYDIETVRASSPISIWIEDGETKTKTLRYDVLLVAQPSHMSQAEIDNLVVAIQSGQPTVIFEDPLPNPENFPQFQGRGSLLPRAVVRSSRDTGKIQDLWDALDLDIDQVQRGNQSFPWIVWQLQSENPYPRDRALDAPERVIVRDESPNTDPRFGNHPSTIGISELYFQYAGYMRNIPNSSLEFEPLIQTNKAGRILWPDYTSTNSELVRGTRRGSAQQQFVLAAYIHGSQANIQELKSSEDTKPSKSKTNVIYICDLDILADYFVEIRNFPIRAGIEYRFQNMSFVLNVIDSMVGEDAYLELRNRKFRHVTLHVVERTTEKAMQKVYEEKQRFEKDAITAENEIKSKINEEITPLEDEIRDLETRLATGEPVDPVALDAKKGILNSIKAEQRQKYLRQVEELQNERREKERSIQLDAEGEIQEIQHKFKIYAVFIPVIPPLLVGLVVFTKRRLREREGISKARRLK